MIKTTQEKLAHQQRTMLINNDLGDEYRKWFEFPEHASFGRYVALGEYIHELCEFEPHDEWLDAANEAYLKWKKKHGIETKPPQTRNN